MDEKETEAIAQGVGDALANAIASVLDVTATLFEHLVNALHDKGVLTQTEIDDLISEIERENEGVGEHADYLRRLIPRLRDRLR